MFTVAFFTWYTNAWLVGIGITGERGHCVYETEAVVLCCDLTLKPADTKAFTYEALLPVRAPPSYKGENIAYFHKLAIGVQRVGNPAELLRIPLRVLPIDPQLLMACRRESAIHAARSAGRLESAIGRPSLSDDSIEFVSAVSMEGYILRSEGVIAHHTQPARTYFLPQQPLRTRTTWSPRILCGRCDRRPKLCAYPSLRLGYRGTPF